MEKKRIKATYFDSSLCYFCLDAIGAISNGKSSEFQFHRCPLYTLLTRLDYQPQFGKGARAPPPNSGRVDHWNTRERRKSSLTPHSLQPKNEMMRDPGYEASTISVFNIELSMIRHKGSVNKMIDLYYFWWWPVAGSYYFLSSFGWCSQRAIILINFVFPDVNHWKTKFVLPSYREQTIWIVPYTV